MSIAEINQYYKYTQGRRNIKHLLSNIVGAYLIYEVHRQNLLKDAYRTFIDLELYYNAANALFLQIRSFLNPIEKGSGLWTILQISDLTLEHFKEDFKKRHISDSYDRAHYAFIQKTLGELKAIKATFEQKKGPHFAVYQLIKKYETLEFHLDRTPEKESINKKFLKKFVTFESQAVLDQLPDVLKLIEIVAEFSGKYADCIDGGLGLHRIIIGSDISSYAKKVHKRIGRRGTKSSSIASILQTNLPKTIEYLDWSPRNRRRTYGPYTEANDRGNMPEAFNTMPKNKQKLIVNWCSDAFIKIESINATITSYGLKHHFERCDLGEYISNGQFKGAMLAAGFRCSDKLELNWKFNISGKSPELILTNFENNTQKTEISTKNWSKEYRGKVLNYLERYRSSKFEIQKGNIWKKNRYPA